VSDFIHCLTWRKSSSHEQIKVITRWGSEIPCYARGDIHLVELYGSDSKGEEDKHLAKYMVNFMFHCSNRPSQEMFTEISGEGAEMVSEDEHYMSMPFFKIFGTAKGEVKI
jgi:hypothetical protein